MNRLIQKENLKLSFKIVPCCLRCVIAWLRFVCSLSVLLLPILTNITRQSKKEQSVKRYSHSIFNLARTKMNCKSCDISNPFLDQRSLDNLQEGL